MNVYCEQYGNIDVDPLACQIIQTPEFQRLHLIRQTGFAFLVFPSATHSRFAHSLGVYHLARQCIENLHDLHGSEVVTATHRRLIPIAGLCHDLGHGPFSHVFETMVKQHQARWCHEDQSTRLFRRLVGLSLSPEDVDFVSSCIHPSQDESRLWQYQIVTNLHSGIDVDKLDYLNRDARAFGLPQPICISQILRGMRIKDDEIQ